MKKRNKQLLRTAAALWLAGFIHTQSATAQTDSVMLAMKDELARNMSELKYKEYDTPFYVAYGIDDIVQTSVSASLGAVINASSIPMRSKYVRVMAGDYEFNDESLDSEINPPATGFNSWQIPIENDYNGIRRSLWISTDQIYKSATRIFAEHQKHVASEGKPLEEIPHRTFQPVPVVKLEQPKPNITIDQEYMAKRAKATSALMLDQPSLHNSSTTLVNYHTTHRHVTSEGTVIKTYNNIAMMQISAAKLSPEGAPVFKQLYFMADTPAGLPPHEEVAQEVNTMLEEMEATLSSPAFDDSYDGPVLFLDDAVPTLFAANVINKFTASDIEKSTNGFGIRFTADPFDDKIGEKITSDLLNMAITPGAKEFEDTKLLGSYVVDDEGVKPADTLMLLKNGVLTGVMTTRTIAKDFQKATGTTSNPGVVSVWGTSTMNDRQEMKDKLIHLAREEELDYALIVKAIDQGRSQSCNVYKVNLTDGSEEFLTSARLNDFDVKSLKKLKAVSTERKAYNFPGGKTGTATSYVVPAALLIEDVEIEKSYKRFTLDLPLVESP